MGNLIGAARPRLRRFLASHPALYLPLRRQRAPGTVLTTDTDLVIEGFPRCANTWTEALVRTAGPTLSLAHHSHAAAHVIAAVHAKVPALVLYRAPDDAVRSLLAMFGTSLSAHDAFSDFAAFYRTVLALPSRSVLLVPFQQATETPNTVIAKLIRRFNLPLDPAPLTRAQILETLAAKERPLAEARRLAGKGPADPEICAPGNAERVAKDAKASIDKRLASASTQKARIIAQGVFAQLERAAADALQ